MPTTDHIFSALDRSFKMLNYLAIAAATFFVGTLATQMFGLERPEIFGLAIAPENALIVLAFCTFLHIGILRYIIHYLAISWSQMNERDRLALYYELTGGNHLITSGAEALRNNLTSHDGILFVRVRPEDPPFLLHWTIFAVAVLACVRFEYSLDFLWSLVVAVALGLANWQIGSSWLVALADIGRPSEVSYYFRDPARPAPRYLGIISGPWMRANSNIFTFLALTAADSFVRTIPLIATTMVAWGVIEAALKLAG